MYAAFVGGVATFVTVDPDGIEVPAAIWRELPADFDSRVHSPVLVGDDVVLIPLAQAQRSASDKTLRIRSFLPAGADPATSDYTLLGLNADPWQFVRGARTTRSYRDANEPEKVIVSDTYVYELDGKGHIDSVQRMATWFNADDSIGLMKDISPHPNKKAMKQLNRDVRQGRIDYLEAAADEMLDYADVVPEPYATQYRMVAGAMEIMFRHYARESDRYISRGTGELEQAVRAETDPQILATLAIVTAPPSAQFPNGLDVRGSLLYQITGNPA